MVEDYLSKISYLKKTYRFMKDNLYREETTERTKRNMDRSLKKVFNAIEDVCKNVAVFAPYTVLFLLKDYSENFYYSMNKKNYQDCAKSISDILDTLKLIKPL